MALGLIWAQGADLQALQVATYSNTVNDRFSSGFATNPVANSNTSFVGAGFDWSGVGWSAMDGTKGFGFISPQHYLVARHYGGAATIQLVSPDGTRRAATQAAVTDTTYGVVFVNQPVGDLSIGRLTTPMPGSWQIARYGVLDLNSSSSVNNSYNGQPLLVYGRGPDGSSSPRIGAATINGTALGVSTSQVTSAYTDLQLQVGDSGSPIFIPWTNPNGGSELTIIGNNAGTDFSTVNAYNYFANSTVMSVINGLTTPDGFALRMVGNSSNTWVGSSSTSIGERQAWGLASGNAPSDRYVTFNGGTAGNNRAVNVNSAANLRGLYFRSTTNSSLGFTLAGDRTLTIGRGGVVNYDIARQTFTANLALGDHQYWDGGAGGITISNLNSSGKLLEITGAGTNRITGNMSGTGGLAVSGGRLEVTASNSYTGATWVHGGRLVVDGRIDASSGVRVGAYGSLGGSGRVAAISGVGSIDPGNSPGILTAPSVDPAGGLDFNFEFTGPNPVYSDAFNSVNDLLRLTSATPFTASLSAVNTVNVYFSFSSLAPGDAYVGGFFTDQINDFLASIDQAVFNFYILAPVVGTVNYNGTAYDVLTDYDIEVTTESQMADFAGGSVRGRVTQFQVVPEPSAFALLFLGVGVVAVAVWRRPAAGPVKD
jgi:autotransporter-associated beta strand protein